MRAPHTLLRRLGLLVCNLPLTILVCLHKKADTLPLIHIHFLYTLKTLALFTHDMYIG